MLKNKFIQQILQQALSSPKKIILPEQQDIRIQEAQSKMRDMGFNILDLNIFNNNAFSVLICSLNNQLELSIFSELLIILL